MPVRKTPILRNVTLGCHSSMSYSPTYRAGWVYSLPLHVLQFRL